MPIKLIQIISIRLKHEQNTQQDEDKIMARSILVLGLCLLFSTTASALDLQREQLLNLYHDVETDQETVAKDWVNLSSGIAQNYQVNEQEEIKFSPLPKQEPKTEFGVFTHETLEEEISDSREYYEYTTPTQFGHSEQESYGIYMKKRF